MKNQLNKKSGNREWRFVAPGRLWIRRIAAAGLCCILCAQPVAAAQKTSTGSALPPVQTREVLLSDDNYVTYLAGHKDTVCPQLEAPLQVAGDGYAAMEPADSAETAADGAIILGETLSYVEYALNVPQAGLYEIGLRYRPLSESHKNGWTFSLALNGTVPFSQANSLSVAPAYTVGSREPIVDSTGNEFAPGSVPAVSDTLQLLRDPTGIIDDALRFYMQAGTNRLRLSFEQPKGLVLTAVVVQAVADVPAYEEYRGQQAEEGQAHFRTEAEQFTLASHSVLSASSDSSDPLMSPVDLSKLRLNHVGGVWQKPGQWLQWEITPEKTGWYSLSFRYQQDTHKGIGSRRRLYVDGVVPFKEAKSIRFPYTSGWEAMTFANAAGKPYELYLEAGRTYTFRMETVLDEMAPVVYQLETILGDLNTLYRKIIMITSTNADKYRDYNLDKEIPGLLEELEKQEKRLTACSQALTSISGGDTSDYAMLMTLARQLRSFIDEPDTIPHRVLNLQSNLGSMSSLLVELQCQPIALDYFTLAQAKADTPASQAGFGQKLWHSVKNFFLSFLLDYDGLSAGESEETISMWFGGGRDQAEIIWKMTKDTFTPETGVGVNIKIVSASIVEASLSGQSPDVAINVARDVPVNLALRGGIRCLSDYPDFAQVAGNFSPVALTPYTLNGKVYALPDTQSFNMMFYRHDVLEELGLSVPDTWDDFIDVANQLQLNKLQAAVPGESDASIYYSLLMQRGADFFNEDHSQVLMDTPVALSAFTAWTDMYAKTGLPIAYDLFNRFRSGELPLAIAPYTFYGQLETTAPEIHGLWGMTSCPGTVTASGEVDRTIPATGTAAVILQNTRHETAAWNFLKWWTSRESQSRYAADVETKLGAIARVALANAEAVEDQNWPKAALDALQVQRASVRELPQVPGQYYVDRDLVNAFRDVVYENCNPLESVKKYSLRINSEIQRKREEFGLE